MITSPCFSFVFFCNSLGCYQCLYVFFGCSYVKMHGRWSLTILAGKTTAIHIATEVTYKNFLEGNTTGAATPLWGLESSSLPSGWPNPIPVIPSYFVRTPHLHGAPTTKETSFVKL